MKYRNKSLRERLLRCIQQYLIGVVVVLLCPTTIAPAQTAEQIAEKTLAATVYLEMKDRNGATLGFGSGFFVKENLIATNYHVIEGAAQGTAKLVGKYTTYTIEGITAIDEKNDLALLKVTAYGITPLPLGDSDNVRIGATVYVAGNPKGLEGTFSNGIISSRRDRYTQERLQMTAPISPGSSGGPVLNRRGEIIGVSFMTIEGGQNLNFAIPSNYLKILLTQSGIVKYFSQVNQSISAETYLLWGYVKDELGDHIGAISDYTQAIQLKPNYADAYYNRGVAKGNLGRYKAAIADYDMAILLKPDDALAYNNRGIAKHKQGQYSAAIADYIKAIQLKPDLAEAYSNRGLTKGALGQPIAAIDDCNRAIQLKPDLAEAYLTRGLAQAMLIQPIAAIDDCNRAIQLKPDYAEAYYVRGLARVGLGQHTTAIVDCNKAIQLKPDYAEAHFTRGFAKYRVGRIWEAKQDLRTALRLAKQIGNESLKTQIEVLLQKLN